MDFGIIYLASKCMPLLNETFRLVAIRQLSVKFSPPSPPHLSSQWMTTSPTNVGSPHPLPFLPGAARHGQQTTWPCWVETQTHSARLSTTITTFALLSVLQVGYNHILSSCIHSALPLFSEKCLNRRDLWQESSFWDFRKHSAADHKNRKPV